MLLRKELLSGSVWRIDCKKSVDEFVLSWNMQRPSKGKYRFSLRFKTHTWSSWMTYAVWGCDSQSTFEGLCETAGIKLYQDIVFFPKNTEGVSVEVKVESEGGAPRRTPLTLFACLTKKEKFHSTDSFAGLSISLPLVGLSQMVFESSLNQRICSPVSTASVVSYLNRLAIDPLVFASRVRDHHWDVYGNWALNVAQAYVELGAQWCCWVERLPGFGAVLNRLKNQTPVVVSVKGPLPGSSSSYADGHLMVVCGYCSMTDRVICMDPAFPCNEQTIVLYDRIDFLLSWSRRSNTAYLFEERISIER